jgi:hypothetical protein
MNSREVLPPVFRGRLLTLCGQSVSFLTAVVSVSTVFLALSAGQLSAADVDYLTDVKPILERCYACHGALQQQGSLRLDTAVLMREGGDSGPAVVPGSIDESLLIDAVTGEGFTSFMPPEGEATRLTEDEIATLRAWIAAGAPAPSDEPTPGDPREHWAFQPPVRPAIPMAEDSSDSEETIAADTAASTDSQNSLHASSSLSSFSPSSSSWVRTPIDAFVQAKHQQLGLRPTPPADRSVLLRRVYLDLIGLPPTVRELEDFLADQRPDAYERVVQRLLESPLYGERWGRHWMDVWRYGDWAGYRDEIRESQYHLWRWRDWIVESLNADRPYDEMIREMIAGDELAPTDTDVLRATGYLGRNWYKFNRNVWLDNTVEHSGKAFLGLTFNCARCHDHKYDPISHREYFQMRAIFETHDVRYDPVPGEPDVTKNGLARVFDKRLDDPTYLFIRGNEARPDKDHPLPPELPELFGERLEPESIELPVESYYPALFGFLAQQARQAKNDQLSAARANWEQEGKPVAVEALDRLLQPDEVEVEAEVEAEVETEVEIQGEREGGTESLAKQLEQEKLVRLVELAEAELQSFEARLIAERVKYGVESGDAASLSASASSAERQVTAIKLLIAALEARQQLHAARQAAADDEAAGNKVAEAESKLAEATNAWREAEQRRSEPGEDYSPLGEIYPSRSSGRRLALARWISGRENPLTARVAVNHIWARHFGQPLVSTVFDFGLNGQPPTHPELLDWLAVELMDNGWRMKPIHRLIVLSATYRQGSGSPDEQLDPDPRSIDPDNRWLWRMNKRRMEAEVVRDSLLAVGGSLDGTMGGPEIDQDQGEVIPRRSIYFRHGKEKEMLFTKVFDGPGVSECYQRGETIVPQQSLALANSPLAKAQSRRLAAQIIEELGPGDDAAPNDAALNDASQSISAPNDTALNDTEFIERAFWRILSRRPDDEERRVCHEFLVDQARLLADTSSLTPVRVGEAAQVAPAERADQRARENLIHVLLNHHDFVTIH